MHGRDIRLVALSALFCGTAFADRPRRRSSTCARPAGVIRTVTRP
jgi:hypothetical protein